MKLFSLCYLIKMLNQKKNIYIIFQILFLVSVIFTTYVEGSTKQPQRIGDKKMKNWSLGRIDFDLSQQYKLLGRNQNIYYVDVTSTSISELKAEEVWRDKVKTIKAKHIKSGNKEETIRIKEIEPNFKAIFYHTDTSSPELVKLEAQKSVKNSLLEMKFEGKTDKENDMIRGLSIIANAYHTDTPYGFNVGSGSVTSTPGLNEYARATFNDQVHKIDLNISTQVATTHLNQHPLHDIEDEIKGLTNDGIILKVLKNEDRSAAGFKGYEGIISLDDGKEEPQFRFTWFTPGETADSFKPEILIKVHGPLKNIDLFKATWEELLNSIKIRREN